MAQDSLTTRDVGMSLSPPSSAMGRHGVGTSIQPSKSEPITDFASFYKNMENTISKTLTHQRSMIEVPQGILNLKNELGEGSDSEGSRSRGDEDSVATATETGDGSVGGRGGELKDSDEEESFDLNDDDLDLNNPELQKAIAKDGDIELSSGEDEEDGGPEFSHSRDRSAAKIGFEVPATLAGDTANAPPPTIGRRLSPYADKRASEIEQPTSPTTRPKPAPMRTFASRPDSGLDAMAGIPEQGDDGGGGKGKGPGSPSIRVTSEKNESVAKAGTPSLDKEKSVPLKDGTPSFSHTQSVDAIGDDANIRASALHQSSHSHRRSGKHRHSAKRRSRRQVHRATIANDFDDEDGKSDDDFNTFKASDEEESMTMEVDLEFWHSPKDGTFEECDLRFDEDDIQGGKKPPASEFRNLKLFFHFFYDRFHHNGTLLLETCLPTYHEWKASRKVKFRNASIKRIDHCLKACNESVHSLRAMCYNCVLLCHDRGQNVAVHYPGCQAPKINPCVFDVGEYSIVSCWDLFELGASPSSDDWRRALSDDCVAQFLCHAQPDLRHFDKEQRKEQYTFQIIKKYQLYCLAEHMKLYISQSGFGSSMEWKKIKSQFLKKCDKDILNSIDQYTYYLNPRVDSLANILSDTANSILVASKRKIICEPILWLIYVGYFLLDRQQKLQQLVLSSFAFADNTTKVKGQKLKTMIENLGKQAKDESERLRKIMARLPSQEDLQKTFELEINERDPKSKAGQNTYTRSFKREFVISTKQSMTEIIKEKR